MVQICPHCHKTIPEDVVVCPYCDVILMYEDALTLGKMKKRKDTTQYGLGFLLLFSAAIYWLLESKCFFTPNWLTGGVFIVVWLAGFGFYCAYIGKGDRDFWWGK